MFWSGILKIAWGGLIVSGSLIYANIHFHICVTIIGFNIFLKMLIVFLIYIVPISGSLGSLPPDPGVKLLIWFCNSAAILFNN